MRTVGSLFWGGEQVVEQAVHLVACLHDANGVERVRWRLPLLQDTPFFFDSAAQGEWSGFPGLDGILALHLCTDEPPLPQAMAHERLLTSVDWRSPDGRLATLHSDQILSRRVTQPQGFTEIVVIESDSEHNALVILNGEQVQAPGALSLTVSNHHGAQRTASLDAPMAPFTVTEVGLARLFPGLAAFAESRPLLVEGSFESKGLYTRPYVVTSGTRHGIYHAGNLYHWPPLHPARHAILQGEVNPMAVMQDRRTRTWINLLHSHVGHDEDVPVDVRLFDDDGHCVLDRTEAFVAARGKLTRIDLATLLPPGNVRFSGHIALSFSISLTRHVPRHLQALVEYEQRGSVAHIMGWSDEWNSRQALARRQRGPAHVNRSWYRVWSDGDLESELVITNAGHRDYCETAKASLVLYGCQGAIVRKEVAIAPYATLRATLPQLFGNDIGTLGAAGVGALRLDSTSDLAAISVTSNREGTAFAMEHFMSLITRTAAGLRVPAGS